MVKEIKNIMYLEIKAVISGAALVVIFYVISQILFVNVLLGFLLIVAGFSFIFGDILIGIKITKTNANYWYDPLPQGTHEICLMKTLSGLVDLFPVTKGPKGIRYGVLHKKKIAVLNDGGDQFHTRNGNLGFFAHENYDKNIVLKNCKALESLEGDDIKEIYRNLKELNKPLGKKPLIEGFVWSSNKSKK